MSDNNSTLEQIRKLQKKIDQAKSHGEYKIAAQLIDEIIFAKENAGLDAYHDRVDRELLQRVITQSKDFSDLITLAQDRLEDYQRLENLVEQIDLLITLAGLCIHNSRNRDAADYLQRADELLDDSDPEEITRYFNRIFSKTKDEFLKTQRFDDTVDDPSGKDMKLELLHQSDRAMMTGEKFIQLRRAEVKRLMEFMN